MGTLWPVADSEPRHRSDREQLFEAVYRVLAGLAAKQPVLLILEDVHWIDASSRDLLSFVVTMPAVTGSWWLRRTGLTSCIGGIRCGRLWLSWSDRAEPNGSSSGVWTV